MHRRDLLKAIAGAAALVPLAACGAGGGGGASATLKIGSQRGGTKALMLASKALEGAPYKVEWSEFAAAQPLLEAVSAGAADLGAVGDAPFLFAYSSGAKIKAVQATRSAGGGASTALISPKSSAVLRPEQLKGRRVATGRGSIGHYLLIRVLERAGLKASDVETVFLAPGDAKAAFSSGAIDAWATWGPYLGAALNHDGAHLIADGRGLLTGLGFYAASQKAIETKRPQLTDFLHRLRTAQDWVTDNRPAFAKVMASETGLPLDIADYVVNQSRGVTAPLDGSVIAEEREVLAAFARAGVIAQPPQIDGAFDPSFNA